MKYERCTATREDKSTKDWKSHRRSYEKLTFSFIRFRLMSLFNLSLSIDCVWKVSSDISFYRFFHFLQNSTKQFNRKSQNRDLLLMYRIPFSFFSLPSNWWQYVQALDTDRCSSFCFGFFFFMGTSFVSSRQKRTNGKWNRMFDLIDLRVRFNLFLRKYRNISKVGKKRE